MSPDDLNPELDGVDVGAVAAGFYGVSGMGGCLPGCLFLAFPPVIGGVLLGLLGFRSVPWSTPEGMFKFFGLCELVGYGLLVLFALARARRRRRATPALARNARGPLARSGPPGCGRSVS